MGALIIIADPRAKRVGEEPNYIVSALSLTANIPGAAYFMLINYFQKYYLSPESTVAIITLTISIFYIVLAVALEGAKFDTSD